MIDEKHLVPVLDQVLAFVDEALADHEAYQTKIADLQNQKVESERLLLEKVASAKKDATATIFPEARLTNTLDHLVRLHILHPLDTAKVAARLRTDPAEALTLLENISDNLTFPKEGAGIPKNTGSANEPDPDGWGDFAAGRPVQLKA